MRISDWSSDVCSSDLLAQQAAVGEVVQRVVDGGERHRNPGRLGLGMQLLGRYVAVAGIEQQARQGQALTGGTQTRAAQTVEGSGVGACCHPGFVDRGAANGHRASASRERGGWGTEGAIRVKL